MNTDVIRQALEECRDQLALLAKDPDNNPWIKQANEALAALDAMQSPDLGKIRQWTFYECENCKAMYLENPVSVCDCEIDADRFKKRIMVDAEDVRLLGIPEGWQLTPKEPTQEMIIAGNKCDYPIVSDIYRAMLAAAPQGETR